MSNIREIPSIEGGPEELPNFPKAAQVLTLATPSGLTHLERLIPLFENALTMQLLTSEIGADTSIYSVRKTIELFESEGWVSATVQPVKDSQERTRNRNVYNVNRGVSILINSGISFMNLQMQTRTMRSARTLLSLLHNTDNNRAPSFFSGHLSTLDVLHRYGNLNGSEIGEVKNLSSALGYEKSNLAGLNEAELIYEVEVKGAQRKWSITEKGLSMILQARMLNELSISDQAYTEESRKEKSISGVVEDLRVTLAQLYLEG